MQETTAENRSRRLMGCLRWFVIAVLAFLVFGLVAPIIKVLTSKGDTKSSTQVMLDTAVTAINSYKTEYGCLPGNRANGRYEDTVGNAQIFAALRALDLEQNSRQIVYFEARIARPRKDVWNSKGELADGFDPQTGALLDRFGQPYRIRVTPRLAMHAESPYADVPASRSEIIVWSTGPDGKQGNPSDSRKFAGSDDIYRGLP